MRIMTPNASNVSRRMIAPLVRAGGRAISLSPRACDRRSAEQIIGEYSMGYRVAVVGATGNVGRELLNILAERQFPLDEVAAVASSRSTGDRIEFGETDEMLTVRNLEHFDFAGWDIALFAAGAEVSRIYAPRAAAAGCTVIDNSSLFRMDPDVPLIVPEVNSDAIAGYRKKNIIANPNCSTAQLVVALKPLHDAAKIRRVVVATYQSVSGTGKAAMDELFNQSRNIFVGDPNEPQVYPKQIAFNVIPQCDVFLDDGSTKEEWKLVVETKKILDPSIKLTATCVRVPVFVGHSEAVNIEFENEISADQAREILRESPGVLVVDKREAGGYVTPVECVGDYATYVSRIREDSTVENGLSLWVVSDNLRKGAALNAVQIAELLGRKHLQKAA
jgi:aspartate-semialdehyde dehydrogenase